MNAGRGILHSEMPEQQHGLMHGFQLWINLPASRKLSAPAYRELEADQIPELRTASGSLIRVIAGQLDGVDGAIQEADTEPQYWDVRLPARAAEYTQQAHPGAIRGRLARDKMLDFSADERGHGTDSSTGLLQGIRPRANRVELMICTGF